MVVLPIDESSTISDDMTTKNNKPIMCVLDQTVVNSKTITQMTDLGLSFFATLCGKNRGVFVLDPSDGHSYGCTAFPPNFAELAGVELPNNNVTESTVETPDVDKKSSSNATDSSSSNSTSRLLKKDSNSTNTTDSSKGITIAPIVKKPVNLKDANAIKDALNGGNITSGDAVKLLDMLVKLVYASTGPGVDQDVYACEVSGLARLQCNPVNALPTIRSVTLTGLFVDNAPWATKGKRLSESQRRSFYTSQDFDDMRSLGLNMVQIPIPLDVFDPDLPATYKSGALVLDHLTDVLEQVQDADLQAILVLTGADNDDFVASASKYAKHSNVVFGIILPSAQSLRAARAAASELKLFVPTNQGALKDLVVPDDNVFAAIDFSHSTSIGDIASSNSQEDRSKMFYHEAISCMGRSPLEYSACFRRVPVLVTSGFDLAIDDCHRKHDDESYDWIDYGQCNRLDETIDSPWWQRHRQSHAARQLFAYEQGMGWSFTAWKLYGSHDSDSSGSSSSHSDDGIMDHPAKLLALKNVAAAGLFPSLHKDKNGLAKKACLNPPVPDFVLGDDTLAPTAGPPPDCGNGWWNETIQDCTYWVPPPEPTPCPTMAPVAVQQCDAAAAASTQSLTMAAGLGALVALVVGGIVVKVCGNKRAAARDGYAEIPSHNTSGNNNNGGRNGGGGGGGGGGYHD